MGMLHAHVSAAQKNLVMWCFGGDDPGSLCLGDKHMLHRCVFFLISNGGGAAAMCDGQVHSPSSQVRPPLLFSPADVVCTQQLAKFKGSPAMEKLCDDNDIRVVTSYLGSIACRAHKKFIKN